MKKSTKSLERSIKIGLLLAIAVILMFIQIPITPFPWLKIDLSEVTALLGGFAFGPMAGVLIIVLKNVIMVLIAGTSSGFVGELANIIIGLALVLPPVILYMKSKTRKTAITGMIIGFVAVQIAGIIANKYLLIPLYGGESILGTTFSYYVIFGLFPLNTIKSVLVSTLTYGLYKKLSVTIFKVEPMAIKNKKEVV